MPLLTIGIIVGILAARRWPNCNTVEIGRSARLLLPPIVAIALFQMFVLARLPETWSSPAAIATTVVGIVWMGVAFIRLGSSPLRVGLLLLAGGALMNLVPMMQHGHMPVDASALKAAGLPRVDIGRGHPEKHVAVDSEDVPWLGDHIAVRPLMMVASPGDLVQTLGVALTVRALWPVDGEMQVRRQRRGPRRRARLEPGATA
jgi:hypothetical protein